MRKKFPDFEFTKKVDVSWAAAKLLDASAARKMRLGMYEASMALKEEDVGSAYAHLDAIRGRGSTLVRPATCSTMP